MADDEARATAPFPDELAALGSIINRSQAIAFRWRVAEGWPVEFVSDNVDQLGYTPEDFLSGRVSWPAITHPDDHGRLETEVAAYLRDGVDEFNQEYRLRTASGEWRWIDDRNLVLRDERGEVAHIQGVILDVTERKRAEAALREAHAEIEQRVAERTAELSASEERYRGLVSSIPDGVYRCDRAGRFTFVNDVIVQRSGRSREWFLDHTYLDMVAPAQREEARAAFDAALTGEPTGTVRTSYATASGDALHVEVNVAPIYDGETIVGVAGVSRDVTARKRAEAALRASEARYRALVQASPDAVGVLSREGEVLEVSQRAIELGRLGSADRIVGLPVMDIAAPEDREKMRAALAQCLETGEVRGLELRLQRADGTRCVGEVNAAAVTDADGRPIALVTATRDITARKEAEAELRFRLEFEQVIATISSGLIHLPSGQLDAAITDALGQLAAFANVDCSYVFQVTDEGRQWSNTHEWFGEGIAPAMDRLQSLPFTAFPWCFGLMLRGEAMHVPRVADLPPEAELERAEFERGGIRSIICVPMACQGQVIGLVGFDAVRVERRWTDDEIALLRIVGETFANALVRRRAEEALRHRVALEEAVSAISTRFLTLPPDAVDAGIDFALATMGALAQVDRSYLFLFSDDGSRLRNTHEWCADGIEPQIDQLQDQSVAEMAWLCEPVLRGEVLHVPRVADLPPEASAEQAVLAAQDIQSLVLVPMSLAQRTVGFLGFDSVRAEKIWAEADITLLRTVGNVCAHALERQKAEANYRAIFNAANDAIYIHDAATGEILDANAQVKEMYGYSPAELIGRPAGALSVGRPPYTESDALRRVRRAAQGSPQLFEWLARDRWGREFWEEVNLKRATLGGQERLLAIVRDISARKQAEIELRESEERFRQMAASVREAFWLFDYAEKRVLYASPGYETIWGRSADALYARYEDWVESIHPDDLACAQESFAEAVETGGGEDREYRIIRPDGEVRWVSDQAFPIRDAEGRVYRVAGIAEDITERKRGEEALRASEARYRAIVESQTEMVCRCLPDTTLTFVNEAYCRAFGRSADELVGQSFMQLIPEASRPAVLDHFAALTPEQPVLSHENPVIARDGEIRWQQWVNRAIFDDSGNIVEIQNVGRDITERKRAEERLGLMSSAVAQSTEGIAVSDLGGHLQIVNEAFAAMHGYAADELVGAHLSIFHAPDQMPAVDAANRQIQETGEFSGEIWHARRDGSVFPSLMHNSLLRDDAGRPIGMIGTLRDITERLRREEELVRAQKLEALGVLAGGIAHDFNNILTGILGNLSYARQAIEPASPTAESLADAERAGRRAKRITGQLLALSKGGAPVKTLALLGDVICETAEFALSGSNVRLDLHVADDLWPVEADVGQISQVVQNLIINADQAMPEGGVIEVRAGNLRPGCPGSPAGSPAGWVEIAVTDQGVGIPEPHLEKIFDPYFTTKQSGSGLGLTVCHTIVSNHGGHIHVESSSGHGATFRVLLPAAAEQPQAPAPPEAAAAPITGRVLLMDDDDIVRRAGSWLLGRLGHQVETATDGAQAIELYRAAMDAGQAFDAVILDLTVPGGMGGKECMRRLRELDPAVVAIVCSGYSTEPVTARHPDYGFQGVILKPYDIDDLDAELRRLLARRPQ